MVYATRISSILGRRLGFRDIMKDNGDGGCDPMHTFLRICPTGIGFHKTCIGMRCDSPRRADRLHSFGRAVIKRFALWLLLHALHPTKNMVEKGVGNAPLSFRWSPICFHACLKACSLFTRGQTCVLSMSREVFISTRTILPM